MLKIKHFIFNPFSVNTYVIYNDSGDALLVDVACHNTSEEKELKSFIDTNNLKSVMQINTHCHIDHILGNYFAEKELGAPLYIHQEGEVFLETAVSYASAFGLTINNVCTPKGFIKDNSEIKIGNDSLYISYTPGHASGSICIISREDNFVITGDVLFHCGIGRTDLPTGDSDLLLASIKDKLMTLPDNYAVYPGHGEFTTIGYEKRHNPFL